jgi:branched-chain amino acid transport system permease protein
LVVVLVAAVCLGLFFCVLYGTPVGRAIRCVSANSELAEASGINSRRVVGAVIAVAGSMAGLGGVLLASDTIVSLDIGNILLLPVFAAVVMGGIGSPVGALAAAVLLALVENVMLQINFGLFSSGSVYVPVNYRSAVGFVALILVMLIRPQGLFGFGGRRA